MNVPSPICNEPSLGECCPSLMTAVKSENKMSWEEMNLSVSKKISVIFYVYLFCLPFRGKWGETQWVFLTYRRCEIQTGVTVGTTKAVMSYWRKQRIPKEGPRAQACTAEEHLGQENFPPLWFTFFSHRVCCDGLVRELELHSPLGSWVQACWRLGNGGGCGLSFCVLLLFLLFTHVLLS